MIDAERVVLMTKLAVYEEQEGKKDIKTANFFRGDYLTVHLFKAFCVATISYILVLVLYVLYDFDTFMTNIYQMDLVAFAQSVVKNYFIFTIIYCVLVYVVRLLKYSKAKKNLKCYLNNLKKLNSLYGKQ